MKRQRECSLCELELTELEAEGLRAWANRFDTFCDFIEIRLEELEKKIEDVRKHNESLRCDHGKGL